MSIDNGESGSEVMRAPLDERIGTSDPLLIEALYRYPHVAELAERQLIYSPSLNHHGVNTGLTGIRIGESRGYPRERLVRLGEAGVLHDLGKMFVTKKTLFSSLRKHEFPHEDRIALEQHSTRSAEMIREAQRPYVEAGALSDDTIVPIYFHHSFQNDGYPPLDPSIFLEEYDERTLAELIEDAKTLALADKLDAMLTNYVAPDEADMRAYRSREPISFEAMRYSILPKYYSDQEVQEAIGLYQDYFSKTKEGVREVIW